VIPQDYQNFFLAIAGASAALIGLLFVAISVAPGQVVGPKAQALHEIRATMALSAFVSTLVISLISLLPDAHIGWPATIIGVTAVVFVLNWMYKLRLVARDRSRVRALVLLVIFLLVNLYLASSGIRSLAQPHNLGPVSGVGYAAIGLITLGVDRSWELVGGRSNGVAGRLTDRVLQRRNYAEPPAVDTSASD
jgi:O-antigen/teichoic acid export membrane protein